MKKTSMLIVIAAGLIFSCNAQKLDASKVPSAVKSSFEKQYPGTTGKWEKENNDYEVNFEKDGHEMSTVIDASGVIKETETEIKVAELPETVLSYVKENYKGKTIKEAAKIMKADGTINYEAEVAGKDVIFDANGKFIKEAKD